MHLSPRSPIASVPCQFKATAIADLSQQSAGASVDILGVVSSIGPVSSITTKKGEPLSRRTVTLYDQVRKGRRERLESVVVPSIANHFIIR